MIRYEWKKILIYRKGIIVVLLFLTIYAGVFLYTTTPYDPEVEENRFSYDEYMLLLEGPLTEEKKEYLETENIRLKQRKLELQNMKEAYYSGQISEQDYIEQSEEVKKEVSAQKGFQAIYNQYTYVRENVANRYFLYRNGWTGLLGDSQADYLGILLLVVLFVPVFCEEYQNGMDRLIITERRGAKYSALCKITAVLAITFQIVAVVSVLKLLYFALKFGLPHGDYPLQSLQNFSGTTRAMTICDAYILSELLKLFGYLYSAIVILFISVIVKRSAAALCLSVAVLIFPYFVISNVCDFGRIPGPWGYMVSTIYLIGSQYKTDAYTGERILLYEESSWYSLGVNLLLSILLILAIFCVVKKKNANKWVKITKNRVIKLLMVFALGLCLAGCNKEAEPWKETTIAYNSAQAMCAEVRQYIVRPSFSSEEHGIVCVDTETGLTFWLDRDALISDHFSIFDSIYQEGQYIYYIKYRSSYEAWTPNAEIGADTMAIVALDTSDFSERIVYERSVNWKDDYFRGIRRESDSNVSIDFNSIPYFFVRKDFVYVIDNNAIHELNTNTGKVQVLVELSCTSNIAYDGRYVYYLNEEDELVQYDIDKRESRTHSHILAKDFMLYNGCIYYINLKESRTVYVWDIREDRIEKLVDISVTSLWANQRYLYYVKQEDSCLYQFNMEENEERMVISKYPILYLFDSDKDIYVSYVQEEGQLIYLRVDQECLEVEIVCE